MNLNWFGDSYDIVKRYFVATLKTIDYSVYLEPMFTGNWNNLEEEFYRFVGAAPTSNDTPISRPAALLIDPDTGVGRNRSSKHVTIDCISKYLNDYDAVIAFDQSFSRGSDPKLQMAQKLELLSGAGHVGFYYDSHARFLFAFNSNRAKEQVANGLKLTGLPENRIYDLAAA